VLVQLPHFSNISDIMLDKRGERTPMC
jgi:hypothetical protein